MKKFIKVLTIIIAIIIICFLVYYGMSSTSGFGANWESFLKVFFDANSWVVKNSGLVASLLVGGLILCFVVDPEAAGDAIEDVTSAGAMLVTTAAGGLVSGTVEGINRGGLIMWIIAGLGCYLLIKHLSSDSYRESESSGV